MSNKTRSIIRLISVLLVIVAVLHHLNILVIPALAQYIFWMVVAGFGLLLISSR